MKKIKFAREIGVITSLLVILVAVIIGIVLVFDLLISSNSSISQIEQDIQAEQLRNREYEKILVEFEEITANSDASRFSLILPGEDELVDVITEIESIAEASGGTLVKNLGEALITEEGIEVAGSGGAAARGSSGASLKGNGYAILQITGTLRTRYDGLLEFLARLETSKYFINIESLNVSSVQIEDEPDQIDVRLILNVYVDEIIGL